MAFSEGITRNPMYQVAARFRWRTAAGWRVGLPCVSAGGRLISPRTRRGAGLRSSGFAPTGMGRLAESLTETSERVPNVAVVRLIERKAWRFSSQLLRARVAPRENLASSLALASQSTVVLSHLSHVHVTTPPTRARSSVSARARSL